PTEISTGRCRILRANASICLGNVAENNTVCRSGRIFVTIFITCGSNPISNIRSASSRTKNVARRRFVTRPPFAASKSIIRPGVHTTISAPRLNSAIWSLIGAPPYALTVRIPSPFPKMRHSFPICIASSRVGVITTPIGPSPFLSSRCPLICLSIGNTKASVFPLPVLAIPITSRPISIAGIACAWIAVGFSKPALVIAWRTVLFKPKYVHLVAGCGAFTPRTLIPSSSRRISSTCSFVSSFSSLGST
ncbi:hypothetical protein AX774_g2527, partial [Zancudomyces culisetae]